MMGSEMSISRNTWLASVCVAFAGLTLPSLGLAHGVWLEERRGTTELVYGHGPSDDPYDPAKLTEIVAFDRDGAPVTPPEIAPQDDHADIALAEGSAVVAITFDNGFWSRGPDGWVNLPMSQVDGADRGGRYLKHTLAIVDSFASLPEEMPLGLAILPQTDPTVLAGGEELQVQVLLNNAPLAGAEVIGDYFDLAEPIAGVTDAQGMATITIPRTGHILLAVSYAQELVDDPDAQSIEHLSMLSFISSGGA